MANLNHVLVVHGSDNGTVVDDREGVFFTVLSVAHHGGENRSRHRLRLEKARIAIACSDAAALYAEAHSPVGKDYNDVPMVQSR